MKKKTQTLTTLLALISTFCAFLTMLVSVSNKVTNIYKSALSEKESSEVEYVLYEDENESPEGNTYILESPEGDLILIHLSDENAILDEA